MAGKNHGTWTKVINGTLAQRVAHSPAEAVAFSFDGWTEREEPKAAKADDSDTAPRGSGAPATGDAKSSKSK